MLVANVFLDRPESDVLSANPRTHFIRAWWRYLDDVLCIWIGSTEEARLFLNDINSYDPNIDFTLEVRGNSICFLDLKLSLVEQGNTLAIDFAVHRKEAFTGVSIHKDSLHHPSHKMVSINAALHDRLINLPLSPQAERDEILNIQRIAQINGIKEDIRLLTRRKKLRQILNPPPPQCPTCCTIKVDPPPFPRSPLVPSCC